MTKRRVEITEESGVKLGRLALCCGDIISLDADLAELVVSSGWGRDVVTGEQGERKPGATALTVDSVITKVAQ